MKRIFAALAVILLSGCVSMGKHKALQAMADELKARLEELEKKKGTLEQELGTEKQSVQTLSESKSALEKEKAELTQVKALLEGQKGELEKVTAELGAKAAQLEAEKAALLSESEAKKAQYEGLLGQLKQEVSDGQLKITQFQNMLTVDVADKILFDSGKAELKADGRKVLKKVGEALKKSDKYLRVVGHTDNVPLSAASPYVSNWELSVARSTVVVRFLQDQAGLDPKRLIAGGRSEYSPVAPNDTAENKQKNRRIEITLMDKNLIEAVEVKK